MHSGVRALRRRRGSQPATRAGLPIDEDEIIARREHRTLLPGFLVPSGDGSAAVVDDTGVTEVKPGPPTGGWLQYGYDDSQDMDERRG